MPINFWKLNYMDHNFYEFSEEAEKATEKNKILKFPRYRKNLSYNSECIYSYGSTIAHLDLRQRTIRNVGYRSRTSSKHYNYAARLLDSCYDFRPIESEAIHVHHFDPWMHT